MITKTEARVHRRAVLAKVEVPFINAFVQADLIHATAQQIVTLLTLGATYELADPGHQHIHRRHCQFRPPIRALIILAHVEGLDGLGIVVAAHRLLEHHLRQIPFVLRAKVHAPLNVVVLELVAIRHSLMQNFARLSVRDAAEGLCRNRTDALDTASVIPGTLFVSHTLFESSHHI